MLDSLKHLGFTYATRSGISIGIDDLIIPAKKAEFVQNARDEVIKVEGQYQEGAITNGERKNKVIAIWSEVTETHRRRDVRRDGVARQVGEELQSGLRHGRLRARAAASSRSVSWPACAA